MRLYLIGEVYDAPLHVALETAVDLAAGLDPAKVHGLVREHRRKGLRVADEPEG